MRKLIYLLVVLGFIYTNADAQYYQITANQTGFGYGTQTIGGITVYVDKTGGGFGCPSGQYINPTGFCGVYPYYIGGNNGCRNGWWYKFSQSVTDLRIHMAGINDSDTVRVIIPCNGGFCTPKVINLTGTTSAWSSSCTPTTSLVGFATNIVNNVGMITGLGRPGGYNDIQLDIQNTYSPYVFDSVEIDYRSRLPFNHTSGGDVVYDIAFKVDSCNLHFNVYADTPLCSGRDLKLHATDFPNTTHHWYTIGALTAFTNVGTGTVHANPVILGTTPTSILNNGLYIDSAVRGVCIFRDTFNAVYEQTPSKPILTHVGPVCPGEDDTLTSISSLIAGGSIWFYAFPGQANQLGPLSYPNLGNTLVIPSMDATKAGIYYSYAQSPGGCVSDTANLYVGVNPPTVASFIPVERLGCNGDTIDFVNISIGSNKYHWDFNDGTQTYSYNQDTSHVFHTTTAQMPKKYSVKLTVGSSFCADDTTVDIVINHPLTAAFTIDEDTICQGTTISITNQSVFTPATIPTYRWYYDNGDSSTSVLDFTYVYPKVGTYDFHEIITDFLGCHDTAHHIVRVDSLGSISFIASDTEVCDGKVIQFHGTYSPVGLVNAVWDLDDGNKMSNVTEIVHNYDRPKTYHVSFAADYYICPDITFTKDILIKPYPVVDLGPDTTICPNGAPIYVHDIINDGITNYTWRWNTPTKDSTASLLVYHPGTYSVTATLAECSTSDSVRVFKKCYVDVPNAFTPNGDGNNDYFLPRELLSRGLTKFKMTIYNRWGTVIFETSALNGRGWDGMFNGEAQPTGVYVYLIEASFINGDSEKYQGNVTLLR